ncbi:GntR family transcriptional regulator [Amphritea sp. 2_MG-2023]|jgi:DNA-binding GntR family transcriptional regulator|nr:GntR family transcriptional regulator [Amphritea atlantica]MBU2964095.1 GntR family transcriptional regulator [Amphritea atlantica]MDO6418493.1 GntR family transcriptional regulator [Amphritea sp. 2_MG-2023]
MVKPSIEQIADRITDAIMEHRLPPGSKLAEDKLAGAFNVSRTKIRQAFILLANEGLVTLHPNRGAFVTSPTTEQTRDIFKTRRLIEPEIIRDVIARASSQDIARLRKHLEEEAKARRTDDRRRVIRLSGEFHLLLAELAGNQVINKLMTELCPLTCLIIALYDGPKIPACPEDEHTQIIDAIEANDSATAIKLMKRHLSHIENELNIDAYEERDIHWESIYS